MSGNSEAGVYAAALRLSEPWYLVSTVIVGSAFPHLVSTRRINVHVYRANLDRFYRALVALAYAITIPMTFLAGVLIDVLLGPSYERAGLVLAVHIWASLGPAFATVIAYWLVIFVMPFAFSRTRSQLVRSLIPFPLDRSVSRKP
jgi:O-antigen/teichoic acid export membrane protein